MFGDLAGGLVSGLAITLGTALGFASSQSANALQKEALTHSIRWRVNDARKAGINPIYALGAPTFNMSPQVADFSGLGLAGQDISRAMAANRDRLERKQQMVDAIVGQKQQEQMNGLQIEHAALENDVLRSQLARLKEPHVGPSVPMVMGGSRGAGDSSARVTPVPASPVINAPGNPAREAGNITDYGFTRTDHGVAVVPSNDATNRIQDNLPQELAWAVRNQLLPALGGLHPPSTREFPLPRGYEWRWNPLAQEFRPYMRTAHGGFYRDYDNFDERDWQ